ncbi:MAG: RNA polymerase sigma factor [Gaiellales bacterium]
MDTPTTLLTDGEVIARSLEHAERFGVVFDRHFPAIHRYVRRRAGREVADDVAVDTFVVAFGRRHGYETSRRDARPWLFGIASNLLRDRWRAEQRQLRAWERAGQDTEPELDLDELFDRVDARAARRVVGKALAELDARDRETLMLFTWADLSYDEIAEALAIPAGTVRSRIHRARGQVRSTLTAHGVHGLSVVWDKGE